jgi:hypothetical protein
MKKIYALFLFTTVATVFYSQSLSSITPSSANQGENLDITITGVNTHFTQASGTSLHFSFEQASTTIVNSYDFIDDINLTANITIPEDVNPGTYDITTSSAYDGDLTLENSFTINEVVVLVPTLASISPDNADQGQTVEVTIVGENTNFSQDVTNVTFTNNQSETLISTIIIADENTLKANVTIPDDATIGDYTVTVSSDVYDLTTNFTVNVATNSYLWLDDFSEPNTWTVNNSSQSDPNGWTIDSEIDGWFFSNSISSTSGGNFAELTNGTYDDVTGETCPALDSAYTLTTAYPIDILDLAGNNRVILSWEEYGARFNDLQQVFVSIDTGNNWIEVANQLDYEVLSSAGGSPYDNPSLREVNIGSYIADNPSHVLIRFSWTTYYPASTNNGAWITYGWMIDDVKISKAADNEIINQSSYIFNKDNFGAEYGRTPNSQLSNDWLIGAQVKNDGNEEQLDLKLNADFIKNDTISIYHMSSGTISPDSSLAIETEENIEFETGIYEGIITISSTNDSLNGENFDNNTKLRNFEITNNVYSLDGLGIHPPSLESTSSLGPNNFTASQDAGILVCATMYNFRNRDTINSVTALISANTEVNSEAILYIIDSTDFRNGAFDQALSQSDLYTITQEDIDRQYIEIPVIGSPWPGDGTESLTIEPGNYYAALEISTAAGAFNIAIVDDLTVGQPAWSSAMFLPGEGVYSNGNALAIRLNLGFIESTVSITEEKENIKVYPNPSDGIINISFDNNQKRNIRIRNINGKLIINKAVNSSTEIDFSNFSKGVYLIDIDSKNKSITKKVTIE